MSLLLLMDLETENRIASVLLREAAELRRQAEKDGVRAYLEKPNVRHRPNSRFLTATVLGVQRLCDILLFVEAIANPMRCGRLRSKKTKGSKENQERKAAAAVAK
ncbi:hypothetical protein HID58_033732 [Brassica napus]|uniref:Uncharacterized protein n=1 Tax=Brassica napus TaxID=3708 RepID=A0ABQ8C037_BRANA|nr:hypothetical protein HID58_033732 [Brassica napus]